MSKLLLTEGDTPTHFCEALLQHLGLSPVVEVRNYGGIASLKAALSALAATAQFTQLVTSVGILRDAEGDTTAARASVSNAIAAANLSPRVRTAMFILPDNYSPGMLETLCMEAVRNTPGLAGPYDCVEQFFQCLDGKGLALPDPLIRAKHRAQAYLATRPRPQLFPGTAAYKGYWPWDSPVFDALKAFLTSL